ncbi:9888_t:CDS:2 [Cetraspora pellucida]|uniref:9888_t:CDS:1 n=1 Tax=Cetraspora pellucida TaxID=1433469 RepID=A0A9N9IW53_9GLOM|nr:9888_t:CDS:2 [Cetraspora pellucida]
MGQKDGSQKEKSALACNNCHSAKKRCEGWEIIFDNGEIKKFIYCRKCLNSGIECIIPHHCVQCNNKKLPAIGVCTKEVCNRFQNLEEALRLCQKSVNEKSQAISVLEHKVQVYEQKVQELEQKAQESEEYIQMLLSRMLTQAHEPYEETFKQDGETFEPNGETFEPDEFFEPDKTFKPNETFKPDGTSEPYEETFKRYFRYDE